MKSKQKGLSSYEYERYIASPEWAVVRRRWFSNHGRWCRKCKETTKIHLHHMTYVRLGRELDQDLVALCESCHDQLHASHKKGESLLVATKVFLGLEVEPRPQPQKHRKPKKEVHAPKPRRVLGLVNMVKAPEVVPAGRQPMSPAFRNTLIWHKTKKKRV